MIFCFHQLLILHKVLEKSLPKLILFNHKINNFCMIKKKNCKLLSKILSISLENLLISIKRHLPLLSIIVLISSKPSVIISKLPFKNIELMLKIQQFPKKKEKRKVKKHRKDLKIDSKISNPPNFNFTVIKKTLKI